MGLSIGVAKLGRSAPLTLSDCGFVGGDNEFVSSLVELARLRPTDTFYIIGRNTGEQPHDVGLPSNIVNPWADGWAKDLRTWMRDNPWDWSSEWQQRYLDEWHASNTLPFIRDLDEVILWVGQHGTTNTPIPMIDLPSDVTMPFQSFLHYVGYIIRGVNAWRDEDPFIREEIYLNSDPRNTLKMRDLRWPLLNPVLTQYNYTSNIKHERYGDPAPPDPKMWGGIAELKADKLWHSTVDHAYARLEPCGVFPGTPVGDMLTYDETWEGRWPLGLFINEARWYTGIGMSRLEVMRDWVIPLKPAFIHGVWSTYSQKKLGVKIEPAKFHQFNDKYHSVRCTFTTPSSGSGWATTKPYESFACGTVCFFHPEYDDQDNILKDADPHLLEYLRVSTPAQLAERIAELETDRRHWLQLVRLQREHFDKAAKEKRYLQLIQERLG